MNTKRYKPITLFLEILIVLLLCNRAFATHIDTGGKFAFSGEDLSKYIETDVNPVQLDEEVAFNKL